jgi:hypothetical protein
MRTTILRSAGLILISIIGSGCAEATIASAGALMGIAASAVSTGADVYRLGKLDAADMVGFEEQIAAIRVAADDLGFKIEREERPEAGRWRCTVVDDRNSRIRVRVESRTEKLTRTRIDVGVLGSEPTARLLVSRIRIHIEPATRPATMIAR